MNMYFGDKRSQLKVI